MFCQTGTIEAPLARCHAAQTGVQAGVAAVMDDSVEGCCEVKQTNSRHLTNVCSNQQIAEHLRLSAVELAICRLHSKHQSVAVKECLNTRLNNLLQQHRNK